MAKAVKGLITHGVALIFGVALGAYLLPIVTAVPPPTAELIQQLQQGASYIARFDRDRSDSDLLHWGEGDLYLGSDGIGFSGELSPGPDFILYLSPTFVETEQQFLAHKDDMVALGEIKSFNGFELALPTGVDLSRYHGVIVWCESFNQFITSGVILSHQNG